MTVSLGLLALPVRLASQVLPRSLRRRRAADVILLGVAAAAAFAQAGLWVREASMRARWEELASRELAARAGAIVGFLREKGSRALREIRAVGADPDTRALLSSEEPLSRTARRPVFLDLMRRFPRGGSAGATVYDARGHPRAWSGWAPTATMSLHREPSRDVEVVEIREGNIFTLLQATHPIRDEDGSALGYVVFQEPLRVQFPLENRFFQVEDVLRRLEGGGGVRADVALALSVGEGEEIRSIRPGFLKKNVDSQRASATAAILSGSGGAVGRVSLAGLSRSALFAERLEGLRRVRSWLLLGLSLLALTRLWFAAARLGAWVAIARLGLAGVARAGFLVWPPRGAIDPLGVFDPSWFASIRFGGLLRSPGDLVLTALALVLAGREIRQFLLAREGALRRAAHRYPIPLAAPGVFAALLVGSLLALHWSRTGEVARNANVPLFDGLDPFTSAPASALELSLLLAGFAFLLFADALATVARALLGGVPARPAAALVAALAYAASAAKMGAPTEVLPRDFVAPLPALGALLAFHYLFRRWRRPGAGAILAAGALAALANFVPVLEGIQARRRELVELFALEHTESPSSSRHFLLGSTLDYLTRSAELREVLEEGAGPQHANLAFILWAKSPLASAGRSFRLRLTDAAGEVFSTFSLGYPPELDAPGRRGWPGAGPHPGTSFRREEIGSTRLDVYSGRVPLVREGKRLGMLELSMVYFDDVLRPGSARRGLPGVFTNLTTTEEFLRFAREVPDRVDRYRGEILVSSTDPEGGLGKRVPSIIVSALAGSSREGRWVQRRIGRKLYDLYCVRERDGERTVGYLTFGVERLGVVQAVSLLARSVLVTLVLAAGGIVVLMLFSWLGPAGGERRIDLPRLGFRERVIGGFLLVSLLPTLLLGFAGQGLFVREKRREFQERLEEDLRLGRELLGRQLADAARNAAAAEEVRELFRGGAPYRTLSVPPSAGGILAFSEDGRLLGASRGADLSLAVAREHLGPTSGPVEFFQRRTEGLYACALLPVSSPGEGEKGSLRGWVLAYRRIDPVLAAELERRTGSAVSFFVGGELVATSKPELYQSEILSDLVDSEAYLKIELEGARRALLENLVGTTSFLASYAPLPGEGSRPAGVLSTLAVFGGGALDLDASRVLSRIYFLCLLVFAGAIGAAFVLAGRLTRPVTELTRGVERIGAGALGHRIRTRASGEIAVLVRSFNTMSRRLAESEARDRERREYIEAVIRHVGSGVVSFDARGRVATVNEAAARILEVRAEDLVGRPAEEVRSGPAWGALRDAVEPLFAGRQGEVVREIELAGADSESSGGMRTVRLVATPLADRRGAPQGAVVVFEDLTELIKSKKIKAWAEMARQVAHEIKNPLTPMKLSAQHLRQAWRDKHPRFDEILEESTETIVGRCEALRRIAIEFSDYARMPGRKIRREDLGRLLKEARKLYGEPSGSRVRFRFEVPDGELLTRVDREEVMRLFINLIENSVQAMPEGGELVVTGCAQNGVARVTIRDTGVGIPRENLRRIFEPSFSTKIGGAGLGLPICKAIMEDYGGSIEITSEPGSGTTVTLLFPAEDDSRGEEASRTRRPAGRRKGKDPAQRRAAPEGLEPGRDTEQ